MPRTLTRSLRTTSYREMQPACQGVTSLASLCLWFLEVWGMNRGRGTDGVTCADAELRRCKLLQSQRLPAPQPLLPRATPVITSLLFHGGRNIRAPLEFLGAIWSVNAS